MLASHLGGVVVSKPFAPRHFLPVGWIVVLAVVAAIAVAGVGRLRTHPASEAPKPVAGAPQGPALDAEHRRQVRGSLDALPLAFEVNQGQTDPRIKYMARAGGYTLFLTANDAVFALRSSSQPAAKATPKDSWARTAQVTSQRCRKETGRPRFACGFWEEIRGRKSPAATSSQGARTTSSVTIPASGMRMCPNMHAFPTGMSIRE